MARDLCYLVVLLGGLGTRAAPLSRPVHNDSAVASALDWLDFNYAPVHDDGAPAARGAGDDAAAAPPAPRLSLIHI